MRQVWTSTAIATMILCLSVATSHSQADPRAAQIKQRHVRGVEG
jgi:hypothetical protein